MRRLRTVLGACALLAMVAAPAAPAGTIDGLPDAQIAARFAPRLVLHPDERYWPTSTDELLTLGATLVRRDGSLAQPAPLTAASLPTGSSCVGGLPCAWALRLGCGLVASRPCPAPADAPRLMYARVVRRHPLTGSPPAWFAQPDPAHAVSRAGDRRPVLVLLARRRLALDAARRDPARRPPGATARRSTSTTRATGRPSRSGSRPTAPCSSTGAHTARASGGRSPAPRWSPTRAASGRIPCRGSPSDRTPTCLRP